MVRRCSGLLWVKTALCLSLAFVLAVLSSRSTVDGISMLVLGPSSALGMASARSSEAGAVDRKPKPTRQQDRESISRLRDLEAPIPAMPVPNAAPDWRDVFRRTAFWSGQGHPSLGGDQAPRPAYLRPASGALHSQLPPPTIPFA